MGLYAHLTDAELHAKRDSLLASIEAAATGVASVAFGGRTIAYQNNLSEARRLLAEVSAEIARREGKPRHRPLYLVG